MQRLSSSSKGRVLNTFEVGTDLDWEFTPDEPFLGIHLYHSTGYMVEENFFEKTALPVPSDRPVVGSVSDKGKVLHQAKR